MDVDAVTKDKGKGKKGKGKEHEKGTSSQNESKDANQPDKEYFTGDGRKETTMRKPKLDNIVTIRKQQYKCETTRGSIGNDHVKRSS